MASSTSSRTSGSRARKAFGCAAAIALCGQAVCGGGGGGGGGSFPPEDIADVMLTPAFNSPGLTFAAPVKLVQHPTDANRWYVVQQGGEVRTFLANDAAGHTLAVNVTANLSADDEQGLLGLAFDPDFNGTTGGEVYLAYTDEDAQDSILARYVSTNGVTFVADTNPIVLAIPHPLNNHNGGDIAFGTDTFLYYSMGDGGGGGDPDGNGQNTMTLLGSILRLDVRSTPPMGRTYAIPSTNPFGNTTFCDDGDGPTACGEIWAYGLRNPWRMAFDPQNGQLWLGDVGQSAREEVDWIVAGGNYGWDCFEGDAPHQNTGACRVVPDFVEPEAVYDNPGGSSPPSSAVTGGVVYRGMAISGLAGHYLYADYYSGQIWALDTTSDDDPVLLLDSDVLISAFGQGRDGAVYVVTRSIPTSIYQLVPEPG